jgi:hydroxyacylglutathione hydrolase
VADAGAYDAEMAERLYFRQLLSGRDFAAGDQVAAQMVNFVYLVGDRETGEAVVVDPAYDVAGLVGIAGADGMRLVGALATHHHPDHVGGSFMGVTIQGLQELLAVVSVPVHVHRDEAEYVRRTAQVSATDLVAHASGDTIEVGAVGVQVLHTPGHTPGSQCFLVDGRLVAGDTLFLDGCGRTDLPGSDADAMYDSLQRLAALPDDVVVYPGHRYSVASLGTLGAVKETNYVFKPRSKEQWLTMFGGA